MILGRRDRRWRRFRVGVPLLVVSGVTWSCQAPPDSGGVVPPGVTDGIDDAPDWRSMAATLRSDAASSPPLVGPPTRPVLVLDAADGIDARSTPGFDLDLETSIRRVEDIARRRLDLAVAVTNPAAEPGRPSREATRLYLLGRTAIAAGRPGDAIVPLEQSFRAGGGVASLRSLAEAGDLAGRSSKAIEARLELARRGALDRDGRALLVDGLWRRGRKPAAIAAQSAGVIAALGDGDLAIEALRLSVLLDASDEAGEAAMIRAAVGVLLAADDGKAYRGPAPAEFQRFLVACGDDALQAGRFEMAADRWRRAGELAPGSIAIRMRRLRVEAALGRDLAVQAVLLDAAASPSDPELEVVAALRAAGVPFDRVAPILEAMVEENATTDGAWRLLVAIDPERGTAALDRLADGDRPAVAGMLVETAFEAGVDAALEVARSFDGSIEGVDSAVDALLAGPVDAESLLAAANGIETSAAGAVVLAELFRRHDRLDVAWSILESSPTDGDPERIVRLRVAGDAADPQLAQAVPDRPFSMSVECARVAALLSSGEPELAWRIASSLVADAPLDPDALASAGRAAFSRRDGAVEAAESMLRARRRGDDSIDTMLALSGIVGTMPDLEVLSPGAVRTLQAFGDDPRFRAIYDADNAMLAGDAASAIIRLEGMLGDPELRDAVLVRLLAAWRSAGRLAEGRLRLEGMVERYPADPALSDALFAIDRTLRGPRATAIELRTQAARDLGGQPLRRLELVLAEIPESRGEWRRVADRRLDRRPPSDAVRIERLARTLETPGPGFEEALEAVETIELDRLAPRQRRRLASVAAAVPEDRGGDLIKGLLDAIHAEAEGIDVDTAVAVAGTLPRSEAQSIFASAVPAAPWTRLDPSWRVQVARFAGRDASAAELVATFGLAAPPTDPGDAGLVRTATAIAMIAGADAASMLERLDRAAALGWAVVEAWPDGDATDRRRLGAIASDASILGREDLAIELMELAVDERPDDPVLLNNLAYALLERGELQRAERLLEESRRLDPDSASTIDSIGWLRFLQGRLDPGDPESAVSLVRRSIAIRLDEGRVPSSEVLMHLADATWAAGDRAEAEQIWRSLAREERPADLERRLAGITEYQIEVWGAELVPSASIDHLLEGRWIEAARARLEALGDGRDPLASFPEAADPDT